MPDSLISNHSAYVASLRRCPSSPGSAVRLGRNAQEAHGVLVLEQDGQEHAGDKARRSEAADALKSSAEEGRKLK